MSGISTGLQAIFERSRDDFEGRVTTVEAAVAALLAGSLDEELRATAQRDAHKLAGSLGTFGLHRGSEHARELEQRFARSEPQAKDDARLTAVVHALRQQLGGAPAAANGAPYDGEDPSYPASRPR